MTICVLGRQPEIGLAELESVYGSGNVKPLSLDCALVDSAVDLNRLGGSFKTALELTVVPSDPKVIGRALEKAFLDLIPSLPDGKINLGLSFHGFDITPYAINGIGLHVKKTAKKTGRSVRIVPNETPALSSAQTYHNHLDGGRGVEFLVVKNSDRTVIGRVNQVQEIDSYRVRDRERPKRDAFVGMLPPKLAQIMINLAAGGISGNTTVLDPFCGTGVVLQEALLMGFDVYGTDISPKMIDFTRANLDWLKKNYGLKASEPKLEVADATTHKWTIPQGFVVSETYLGQPLGGQNPTPKKLKEIMHETNSIIRDFLKNIHPQLPTKTRLCIAVPAWFVGSEEHHLPLIKELLDIGFSSVKFQNASEPLVYRREDQVTGRELLVIKKIQ